MSYCNGILIDPYGEGTIPLKHKYTRKTRHCNCPDPDTVALVTLDNPVSAPPVTEFWEGITLGIVLKPYRALVLGRLWVVRNLMSNRFVD